MNKEISSKVLPVCFIIMPISDEPYEKGHFKNIYENIFKPACEIADYQGIRADEVGQTNFIHLDILKKLLEAPMVICDLSTRNPNVMFELGIRQAFDKPVVLVQEEGTPQVFDIAPLRRTTYRNRQIYQEVLDDQEIVAKAIKDTANKDEKDINSIVRLLSLTQPAQLTQISENERELGLLKTILAEINSLKIELKQPRTWEDISSLRERAYILSKRVDFDLRNGITERAGNFRKDFLNLSRSFKEFEPSNAQENDDLQSLEKFYLLPIERNIQDLENLDSERIKFMQKNNDTPF